MTGGAGIVRRPTDSEPLRILLAAGECDDALGVVEIGLAPGSGGPPPHVHPTHGEGFYVLEGELTVQVLCVFAPGGFERRFERILARAAGTDPMPERSAAELAAQLLGPPSWAAEPHLA
jgi:hypothetical protein